MHRLTLVIGNKNYSSWSLRPWLLLSHFELTFAEVRVPLFTPAGTEMLRNYSPSGKVPVLIHDDLCVWESLAICEYVSEQLLGGRGWPAAAAERALARSHAAEMHAGFTALRNRWPMNIRLQRPLSHVDDAALNADLVRVQEIWDSSLQRSGGPWLFGDFGIVDAMFAPVVLRFHSYQPALSDRSAAYQLTMLAHPSLQAWIAAARQEVEVIKEDEVGFLLGEPGWQ